MSPEPKKMNELFAAARATLLDLPAEQLERPRIGRERAMQLTTALRQEFEPLLPLLADELAPAQVKKRRAEYDTLEPRVLVYYAADMSVESPWSSSQKERRSVLARTVREHDEFLSGWAVPVFRKDEEASATVVDILRGRGIRDDAEDTVRLVGLFRKHWDTVKGQTLVKERYLDEAEADATELLALLDVGETSSLGSPRDMRQRAFTHWLSAYMEIFHLGRYLQRHDAAAMDRFPAIAPERVATPAVQVAPPPPSPAPAAGQTTPV